VVLSESKSNKQTNQDMSSIAMTSVRGLSRSVLTRLTSSRTSSLRPISFMAPSQRYLSTCISTCKHPYVSKSIHSMKIVTADCESNINWSSCEAQLVTQLQPRLRFYESTMKRYQTSSAAADTKQRQEQQQKEEKDTPSSVPPQRESTTNRVIFLALVAGWSYLAAKGIQYLMDWPDVMQMGVEQASADARVSKHLGNDITRGWLWRGTVDAHTAAATVKLHGTVGDVSERMRFLCAVCMRVVSVLLLFICCILLTSSLSCCILTHSLQIVFPVSFVKHCTGIT
jgi:PBP1b-binding outer membrane lipoprotein LpoB